MIPIRPESSRIAALRLDVRLCRLSRCRRGKAGKRGDGMPASDRQRHLVLAGVFSEADENGRLLSAIHAAKRPNG